MFDDVYLSDAALAKLESEKRLSLILAWEENEKTKADNKYVNMKILMNLSL